MRSAITPRTVYCQRMSNYTDLKFSDEEAITLYLYGVIERYRTLKSIHGVTSQNKQPISLGFVSRYLSVSSVCF